MEKIIAAVSAVFTKDPLSVLIAFFVLLALFFIISIFIGRLIGKLEMKALLAGYEKEARLDAVKRSRSVLLGQLGEQIAPFLPGFPCNPEDARFIGKPIDFIAFSGMSECDDGESGEIREILFIEVKTGNAVLSRREKEIKKAVAEGRVRYIEYRIGS